MESLWRRPCGGCGKPAAVCRVSKGLWRAAAYLKPSLVGEYAASDRFTFYGGGGLAGAATIGTDYFQAGDTGAVLVDTGYVGLRLAPGENGLGLDVSAGKQEYRLGNRLLLSTGGGNGFERGALTTFPHRAWPG